MQAVGAVKAPISTGCRDDPGYNRTGYCRKHWYRTASDQPACKNTRRSNELQCPHQTDITVDHTERNRVRGTVFIPHDLFRIKIINTLILSGISAKGKAVPNIPESFAKRRPEITIKRLGSVAESYTNSPGSAEIPLPFRQQRLSCTAHH